MFLTLHAAPITPPMNPSYVKHLCETYDLFTVAAIKFFPKQFIGDSGSLGVGFLISTFLIIYTQLEKFLHPSIIIWVVAFVVYEFLAINIIRVKQGKNIFKRDLNFIFNVLDRKYSSTILSRISISN